MSRVSDPGHAGQDYSGPSGTGQIPSGIILDEVTSVIHHYPNPNVLLSSIITVTATTAPPSDGGAVGAVTVMINGGTFVYRLQLPIKGDSQRSFEETILKKMETNSLTVRGLNSKGND